MANIYNEQGITQTPVAKIGGMSTASEVKQSAKYFEAIQDNFEKKAKEHQALAEKLYENGSNIAITQGLNELSRNPKYASNPEAFALEADKMAEKIYAQIDDPNMKTEVAMNYELKKNPYINRAYDNMYRQQQQEQQFQTMQIIEEGLDSISLSFSNMMDNTYSVDDFMRLGESIKKVNDGLDAKDSRGFDLLSPSEKRAITERQNKILQRSVINGINRTPFSERVDLVNKIANGEFELIKGFEDSENGREIFVGGLENYLKPESVQYIKAYATGLKDRYDKLKSTKNRNTGLSDREAMDKAATQTIYDLELPENIKEIGKMDNADDRTFAYMNERLRAINLYKSSDIDEKTFKKVMDKSVVPLIKDIETVESKYRNWLMPNGAFRDGVDVIKTLDVQTNEEKAYLYTNLYDALSKDGIEMGSTNSSDKNRAKDIALKIKQEYLENKNANLVGTNVNKVLLGNDVIEAYKPNKEPKIAKPNWKIWVRNDGTRYKVLPDKNGEYTSDSVFIKLGE